MSKVKISEILHIAADNYLDSMSVDDNNRDKLEFTCHAIDKAISADRRIPSRNKVKFFENVKTGLSEMGLDSYGIPNCWTKGWSLKFDEKTKKRYQQERYSWLKFAALIAEEQGV